MAAPFRRLPIALLILGILVTACQALGLGTSKPVVVISAPASGTLFNPGQDVVISSTSTDPRGITRVELLVDNNMVRTDLSPVSQGQAQFQLLQAWKAVGVGTHTVTVRAYNASGAYGEGGIFVTVGDQTGQLVTPGPVETAISPLTVQAPGAATPAETIPAATVPPSGTTSPNGCASNSAFAADVTIPDGSPVAANAAFTKTWRVQNNGSCAWDPSYAIMWVGGTQMASQPAFPVPPLEPGGAVDISIPLIAPATQGSYTGIWRLRDSYGTPFGNNLTVVIVVPNPNPPTPTRTRTPAPAAPVISSFTCAPCTISPGQIATLGWGPVSNATSVSIDQGIGGVGTPGSHPTPPLYTTTTFTMTAVGPGGTVQVPMTINVNTGIAVIYDFVQNGNTAAWTSNFGPVPFGWIDNSRGFAVLQTAPASAMEDGYPAPPRCLETRPAATVGGWIRGDFSSGLRGYIVQPTDRFQATVGLLANAFAGNVNFKVRVRPEGSGTVAEQAVSDTYDGYLRTFDWPLSDWAGKHVDLSLEVDANNAGGNQDWACWVSARIVR